jgi:two-component system, NtrC family, response regulator GlrR
MADKDKIKAKLKEGFGLGQLIGDGAAFCAVVRKIPLVARWDVAVLICGETGTGKDLCGRAIHYLSPRASRPFVAVNCGALPLELVENELFGHERAAFTGAFAPSPGLVQEAEGGTLFLDEVDALTLAAQAKLLRLLQDGEFRPLGSTKVRRADIRVVAATNVDPEQAVAQGRLRRDLYYRLNVIRLDLPPLRSRQEDVPLLARHFLARCNQRFGLSITGFSPQALKDLAAHEWPGNVRELAHTIERAVLLCEGAEVLQREHLDLPKNLTDSAAAADLGFREAKARAIAEFERGYVTRLLHVHGGNISRAARAARKDRKSFWELIRQHHIDADRFKH